MINHVRTLLLNRAGTPGTPSSFLGEEVVPPAFSPIQLTGVYSKLMRILFGNNPDRLMLNYRLRQYMTLLHSSELEQYVLAKDPRVTYWPIRDSRLFDDYGPTITQTDGGTEKTLFLNWPLNGITALERLSYSWQVSVIDADTVEVKQVTAPITTTSHTYTTSGGMSSPVQLGSTSLSFTFQTGGTPQWNVSANARPIFTVPDVVNTLGTLNGLEEATLFNGTPYDMFGRLWNGNHQLSYRLGGLLLALAYRLDAMR